jgi:PAT family beta-lactamase induction signal transducer AmpG
MYAAAIFDQGTSGMGTGAFSVLLLRMTQKRFSATQYALFSSLFALPRLLAGPIAGFSVDAVGWAWFFLATLVMGVPGLVMLARFVPLGVREPEFTVEKIEPKPPLRSYQIALRGIGGGIVVGGLGFVLDALLASLKTMRETPAAGFNLPAAMARLVTPRSVTDWIEAGGLLVFAAIGGLFVAALIAARRGAGRALADDPSISPQP